DDGEPNVQQPEPDFSIGSNGGGVPPVTSQQVVVAPDGDGVFRAKLASWDWGGSVRIDVTDAPAAPTMSASLTLPADLDRDGLPDVYEDDPVNLDKNGENVLDRTKGDRNGNGNPDGQDRFAPDGLTNFEKYRGVYLVAPVAGSTGPLGSYTRLGAGVRNFFVRGRGFSTDPSRPAGTCGLNSLTGQAVASDPTFPCPKVQGGTAFGEAGGPGGGGGGGVAAGGAAGGPTESPADGNTR